MFSNAGPPPGPITPHPRMSHRPEGPPSQLWRGYQVAWPVCASVPFDLPALYVRSLGPPKLAPCLPKRPAPSLPPAKDLGTDPGGPAMPNTAAGEAARVRPSLPNPRLLTKWALPWLIPEAVPAACTGTPPRRPGLGFWVPLTWGQAGKGGHEAPPALSGVAVCY